MYNPATMTWFDLSGNALGTPPTPRYGHGFTSARGKLYVHGGYSGTGKLSGQEHLKFNFLCDPEPV
jgi:hypothetical protein